jgi:hypothetical protein
MLTRLHDAGQAAKHLLREGFLHQQPPLFEPVDGPQRPLLLKALQAALRRGQLDIGFYSRAMRGLRQREQQVQQRLSFVLEGALSALSLQACAGLIRGFPGECITGFTETRDMQQLANMF